MSRGALARPKCPAHKLEFLALNWAITKQFYKYLYGNTLMVYTDNNLLTVILTSAKLYVTGYHWVASFTNYHFSLSYKSGKVNVNPDACPIFCGRTMINILKLTVWALISNVTKGTTFIGVYSCNIQVTETLDMQKDPKAIPQKDWIIAQSQDPVIREIKTLLAKLNWLGVRHICSIHKPWSYICEGVAIWCNGRGSCKGELFHPKRIVMINSL